MKQQYRMRIVSEEQLQNDISNIINNIDDLSAAALGLTNGGQQAYTQFMQLRDSFREHAVKVKNGYKHVEI